MAVGNAIVTTAKFKPLSYKEWAAPLEEISTQHAADETTLNTLSEEANKYERYIRANPNSEVAQQYRNYLTQLDNEVAMLNRYGMTPDRRTSLANLRREYIKQIKPVRTAVETLDDIEKQYIKDSKNGIVGAPDIDVNYLLEHPEYTVEDYKKSYHSGKDIFNESKTLFKGLTGFDATPKQYNDGTTITTMIPQGYTSDEIQLLFTDEDNPNLSQELRDTWKMIKDKYNYDDLAPDQQDLFKYYALQGALSSAKAPRYSTRNAPRLKATGEKDSGNNNERGNTNDNKVGL